MEQSRESLIAAKGADLVCSELICNREFNEPYAMSRYKILIDDNFHFMDENHRYEWKSFSAMEEAIAECKRIVDSDLVGFLKPGITATELYDLYETFGDDPFIVAVDPNDQPVHFSAWEYAKERSGALTSPDKAANKTPKSGLGFIFLGARR